MTNIKKGDTVKVIAGRDKGMEGKVIQVHPADDRLIVEGVNRVKKHTKGDQSGNNGGIVTTEAPIHASNVMILEDGVPVRVGFRRDEVAKRRSDGTTYAAERSVRVSRKTGKEI